jgi:hypothetical protein
MDRRKFLVGMGSLAAGGAAVMGTGAFTTITADRVTTVDVVSDPNAYLALTPNDERAGTQNGELFLDFGNSANGGGGLNPDARNAFHDLFTIRNQGDNKVVVGIGVNAEETGIGNPSPPTQSQNPSGDGVSYDPNGDGLLGDQTGIVNVGVFAERNDSGNGIGNNGSVKMGIDSGSRVWLTQAGDPTGADSRQYLNPGEALNVDMVINTNNDLNGGDLTIDPGFVVMAVEPGSDRDQTSGGTP